MLVHILYVEIDQNFFVILPQNVMQQLAWGFYKSQEHRFNLSRIKSGRNDASQPFKTNDFIFLSSEFSYPTYLKTKSDKKKCNLELVLLPLIYFSRLFLPFFFKNNHNNNSILYFQICQYLSTTETRKKRQSGISSKKKIPTTWDSKFFSKYLVFTKLDDNNLWHIWISKNISIYY